MPGEGYALQEAERRPETACLRGGRGRPTIAILSYAARFEKGIKAKDEEESSEASQEPKADETHGRGSLVVSPLREGDARSRERQHEEHEPYGEMKETLGVA
jgi:hypothetical protein